MSVRMRHTRSHTKNRRSHHALKEPRLSTCQECGAKHERHKVCMECGTYRGRTVIDVVAIRQKKTDRRKEKLRRRGEDVSGAETENDTSTSETPLDAANLSKK